MHPYTTRDGAWHSLVARLLWEQEVLGSNPGAPMSSDADPGFYSLKALGAAINSLGPPDKQRAVFTALALSDRQP